MAAQGAWLAFYEDMSGMALFSSELAAYRHANGTSMQVAFWPFGKTFHEVTEVKR